MDIGVYWSPAVLEHKRERREQRGRPEEVWNCRHLPKGLGKDPGGDWLVVGCRQRWVGAFRLVPEVLYRWMAISPKNVRAYEPPVGSLLWLLPNLFNQYS